MTAGTSQPLSSADQRTVLRAFSRALGREAHHLRQWPELTWQQLYNRLQWQDEPVPRILEAERVRRTDRTGPWMRLRTPLPESESLIRVLAGHTDAVLACAFSPDSSLVSSASRDHMLKLWDATTGAERGTFALAGHTDRVTACAFSPDGAFLATASYDGTARLWDGRSGASLSALEGAGAPRAFSPDGARLATASDDHTVRLWDARSGAPLGVLEGHTSGITACAFSPDGALLATAGGGTVRLWDARSGAPRAVLAGHTDSVNACAFSPDGSLVVSASADKTLKLWELETGAERATLSGHTERVMACAFSPDGSLVVSASCPWRVRRSLDDWADDPRFFLSEDGDKTIRLWDVETGAERATLSGHTEQVTTLAFSPDGSLVMSGSEDGALRIWEVDNGGEQTAPPAHADRVTACAISPGGSLVATASEDMSVRLWDRATGEERATLGRLAARIGRPQRAHTGPVTACAISPGGSLVLSAGEDHTVRNGDDTTVKLWDVWTGANWATMVGHTGCTINACAFSPDGSLVVSAAGDDTLKLWDVGSGAELRTLAGHSSGVWACAFSPDGSVVVSGSADKSLKLWEVETGAERATLAGHTGEVSHCVFSPDGSVILSASWDGTSKLWEVETGAERATIGGRFAAFAPDGSLVVSGKSAFSPDGSLVVSVDGNATLSLWDVETGSMRGLSGYAGGLRGLVLWDVESGTEQTTLPLLEEPECFALDRRDPFAACGDRAGNIYLIDLMGTEYGPLVVTATDLGSGPCVRCPACSERFTVDQAALGTELACPRAECGQMLRLNAFVTRMATGPVGERPRAPVADLAPEPPLVTAPSEPVPEPRRVWWRFWRRG